MSERLIIAGGPRTGKTTLAQQYAQTHTVRHTDDLIGQAGWSEASQAVAGWFEEPGPWVIEGVATPRALRKWLKANGNGKPVDRVIWLDEPKESREPGQDAMAKGCQTVWQEIRRELEHRGVVIEELP